MIEKILYARASLATIARVIGAELPPTLDGSRRVVRVLTQPKYVSPGDLVISGWYPREKTVSESLKKGAVAVFCERKLKEKFPQENVIPVDDPFLCVRRYEQWRSRFCRARRVVVTGSVGKTTTTGLISAVLSASFKTLTSESMANSHDAVLRNVQLLEPSHRYWVQEIGGVHPGYIESSAEFLHADMVVLTNIGDSHLDLYGSRENILKDKASLERFAAPDGVVIVNADDELLDGAPFTHRKIRCSMRDPSADYFADGLRTEAEGLRFTLHGEAGEREIRLNLYGDHNAYNAMFAIAVGRRAGLSLDRIAAALESYRTGGMRQNLVEVGGYRLFVDAFNAEPKTVLGAAKTLESMSVGEGGRKIFVMGHIDKLGAESAEKHAEIGRALAAMKLDLVLLYAGDCAATFRAMKDCGCDNVRLMETREELETWLETQLDRRDLVFFKSGQFLASLGKSVDHVFGTAFQTGMQWNDGSREEKDGFVFRLHQDRFAELEGYTGAESELSLPARCGEHVVTRIAPGAFAGKKDLRSVVIPASVRNVGERAFDGCAALRSVVFSPRLRVIEDRAFRGCRSLSAAELPEGTIHLGAEAFAGCMALKTIRVPESVGHIGPGAIPASCRRL